MICLICRQAEIISSPTSITFARNEFRLVMNNVPAHVCPSCGEAYVDEEIAAQLLQAVEEMYKAGILENVSDYERPYVR